MVIQKSKKSFFFRGIFLFIFIFSYSQNVQINVNQLIFKENSKIEYEIDNRLNNSIYYYIGIELYLNDEWRPFRTDININSNLRKARIVNLSSKKRRKDEKIISKLFDTEINLHKNIDLRLSLKYSLNKKNWNIIYSKPFKIVP